MLSAEIAALRRIGPPADFDGGRMAFAFGCCLDDPMPAGRDYHFDVELDGGELVCTIDVYSAIGYQPAKFDVDAWEAKNIRLHAPVTRDAYRSLQSAARAILKGLRVVLPDGEMIHVKELAQ